MAFATVENNIIWIYSIAVKLIRPISNYIYNRNNNIGGMKKYDDSMA